MQLHIPLNAKRDADLIAALQAIPKGERSAVIRTALTERFVRQSDIAQALHRLADVLEAHSGGAVHTSGSPASASKPTVDTQKAAVGLFKKFGAFDDD